MNLADLVRTAAGNAPDRPALVYGGHRVSWAELDAQVESVAQGLCSIGLNPGDRVAILLPNGIEFVVAWFATLRAGLVAVPVTRSLTDTEASTQLADCGAALLITEGSRAASLGKLPAAAERRFVVVGGAEWTAWLAAPSQASPASYPETELAALIYTSGTARRPRGVMLTHAALLANVAQAAELAVPAVLLADVVLLVLPLSHIYALNVVLSHVASVGATAVLANRFDPIDSLDMIEREGVTVLVGAPPMYVAWSMLPEASRRLRGIRLAVSGAAPLPVEVHQRFGEITGCSIYEGYGMTEASPILTSTLVADAPLAGSVGRPLPNVDLRIVDEDGQDVVPGESGEIVVRGPNLFVGYWPDAKGGPDAAGWFATNDLGRADEDGNVYLTGRKGDLIIVSGFNVAPREVEEVLAGHPDVADVAVIGIPHPYMGEAVKAFVVPRPGKDLNPASINAYANARLARFKSPTVVEIVEEIPAELVGHVGKLGKRPQTPPSA